MRCLGICGVGALEASGLVGSQSNARCKSAAVSSGSGTVCDQPEKPISVQTLPAGQDVCSETCLENLRDLLGCNYTLKE